MIHNIVKGEIDFERRNVGMRMSRMGEFSGLCGWSVKYLRLVILDSESWG